MKRSRARVFLIVALVGFFVWHILYARPNLGETSSAKVDKIGETAPSPEQAKQTTLPPQTISSPKKSTNVTTAAVPNNDRLKALKSAVLNLPKVGPLKSPATADGVVRSPGILGHGSIRIWTAPGARLNKSTIVVAYNVESPTTERSRGGLVHVPSFDVRFCTGDNDDNLPQCPTATEIYSKVPLFGHERDVANILLTIYDKDGATALTDESQPVHVTYWDGEKSILVNPGQWLSITCRRDIYCLQRIYLDAPPPTSNRMYFFDKFDYEFKPLVTETRKPIRPWWGPCSCGSTCMTNFTEESTFPYASKQDYDKFGTTYTHKHMDYPLELKGLKVESNYTSACSVLKDNSSLTASPYRQASFSHHLFFIPQIKLIYCGIPKVGMTEWLKFFRHVLGANDYLGLSHFKWDLKEFAMRRLSPEQASALWTNPAWIKAVFIRDPAERLLSAYLDKIVGNQFTQTVFMIGDANAARKDRYVLNFTAFVDLVTYPDYKSPTTRGEKHDPRGIHRGTDPHWKPQLWTCGMDEMFPLVDFVGNFKDVASQTKLLLHKVGGWDKWGATYDTKPGNERGNTCHRTPRKGAKADLLPGLNQQGRGDEAYKHSTGADSLLNEYYTPELLKRVRQAYAMDYAVWDEIKDREPENVAAARDLKCIQTECGLY